MCVTSAVVFKTKYFAIFGGILGDFCGQSLKIALRRAGEGG